MANIRQETVINNATFTATVTSPVYANDDRAGWVLVSTVGLMTTTPTLQATVQGSLDGVTFYTIDQQPAISTASATQRTVYGPNTTKGPILEPYIRVLVTFGGTGSFANTSVALFGGGFLD